MSTCTAGVFQDGVEFAFEVGEVRVVRSADVDNALVDLFVVLERLQQRNMSAIT